MTNECLQKRNDLPFLAKKHGQVLCSLLGGVFNLSMQSPLDYLEVVLLNEVKDGPPQDTRTWWQFVEGEGKDVL